LEYPYLLISLQGYSLRNTWDVKDKILNATIEIERFDFWRIFVTATIPTRNEVPVELTWDLESIFATDELWEENFAYVSKQLPTLAQLQGSLAQSASGLYKALQLRDKLGEIYGRLMVYATMRFHEDTTRPTYQALADRVTALAAEFSAVSSFFVPEILAIPDDRLATFFADEPQLELYRHEIDEITRVRAHIRNAEVEQVLASMLEIAQAPEHIFSMIDNADLHLPAIEDEKGNEQQLTHGNYIVFLQSPLRHVRKAAFEAMHSTFRQQQNTLAANLATQVKKNLFFARARRYDTALNGALDENNIPTSVYTNLIATVNANLPKLHRYLALRQRALKLEDQLHMYDLHVPLVGDASREIAFDEARNQVAQALTPLGENYTNALTHGMHSRWIDILETKNKRSGAYSWGAYGTHPFVLLNYQSRLEDVFTLAHEMGHSMHSFYTWSNQPYPYASYTIFLAEIASTLNEALLTHYLVKTTEDREVKAYVLNHYLDGFRATLFRQTMFADFELQIHTKAEAGEALTPELLCTIYKELNDRQYGDGGVAVDDLIAWEWSRIPHFYSSFYVYQYSTGIAAAAALSRAILNEGAPAVERYLTLLRSGSSNYSIELLKAAGVDMTTPEPIEAAIAEFDATVGELEQLLG
jgi:oligoendopeptidase F